MLDVASGEIRRPDVVVIEGDKIRAVNPPTVPTDATVIELGDATLLPGLMDMHIHLMIEPGTAWIRQPLYETPAEIIAADHDVQVADFVGSFRKATNPSLD